MTDDMDLLPCPFCGTDPDNEDCRAELDEVFAPRRSLEMTCGKCGAMWPPLFPDMDIKSADDLQAFWNRRAAQ